MAKVKAAKEVVEEVKQEVNSWLNKENMDKIIKTLAYLPVPCAVIFGIWGIDYLAFVESGLAILISICEFIKLFLKD